MVPKILTQIVLFNINNLLALTLMVLDIANINSFICTQLYHFKHYHITQTIQFRHTVKEFQVLLINTNNSIQHYSFNSTQLNCSKSLTIQLNISHLFTHTFKWSNSSICNNSTCHLFAHSLNENRSIWPIDRILSGATTPDQSGPGSNGNEAGTPYSPKFQHYWSLTIRLFRVISRHSLQESDLSAEH